MDNRTRAQTGQKGTEGLSESEKLIYDFIKSHGRATRDEVIRELKFTSSELQMNLIPMFHAEIVKEKSEDGWQYLVPLK